MFNFFKCKNIRVELHELYVFYDIYLDQIIVLPDEFINANYVLDSKNEFVFLGIL